MDPKLVFHISCEQDKFVALPILDKIVNKTLFLSNYNLTAGHCSGLAAACGKLDSNKVNRVLFNNCGIDGNQFAKILNSLANVDDLKSIIYKKNQLNAESVNELQTIFKRKIPFHLEELKLIDLKVSSLCVE